MFKILAVSAIYLVVTLFSVIFGRQVLVFASVEPVFAGRVAWFVAMAAFTKFGEVPLYISKAIFIT